MSSERHTINNKTSIIVKIYETETKYPFDFQQVQSFSYILHIASK